MPLNLIDPMDFRNDPLLKNMQGNILKGHGRDHTTHIFLQFKKGQEAATKQWIGCFSEKVTSLKKQLYERDLFKRNKVSGECFRGFFLSCKGYLALGFSDAETMFTDPAFTAGMQNRRTETNDPAIEEWEKGLGAEQHAMILLADDNVNSMAIIAKEIITQLKDICTITTIEYGNAIRNANGDGLEHFGYVDGISQPLFFTDEVKAYESFHSIPSLDKEFDPAAEKELVVDADPYASEPESYGSYFVFRKLEQNVKGFKKAEEALDFGELGGAYLVGRFEDGTPVVKTDEDGMIGGGAFNNFNYSSDSHGSKCPYFAHIRKTNPREELKPDQLPGVDLSKIPSFKTRIMARRGIPYGSRQVDTATDPLEEQMPEGGVGLLFMSYQQSIVHQFEFIQQSWANNAGFPPLRNTGVDAIIGQVSNTPQATHSYEFPAAYGSTNTVPVTFQQFVTMKGGEYFYAPSIPFLRSLNTNPDDCGCKKPTETGKAAYLVAHDVTPKSTKK